MFDQNHRTLDYCINISFLSFISEDKSTLLSEENQEMFFLIAKKIKKFDALISWGIEKEIIEIGNLISFAEICKSVNIDIYKKNSVLKKELKSIDSAFIDIQPEDFYSYSNNNNLFHSLSLLSLKNNYDFASLGKSVFEYERHYYVRIDLLKKLAKIWALNDPSTYTKFFESSNFNYEKRSVLAYGMAFTKISSEQARKFRSECKAVSYQSVCGLIDAIDIYSDLEFAQVISNFSDSKHDKVLEHLAKKLPLKNINILLANNLTPKYILERRIAEQEK